MRADSFGPIFCFYIVSELDTMYREKAEPSGREAKDNRCGLYTGAPTGPCSDCITSVRLG